MFDELGSALFPTDATAAQLWAASEGREMDESLWCALIDRYEEIGQGGSFAAGLARMGRAKAVMFNTMIAALGVPAELLSPNESS